MTTRTFVDITPHPAILSVLGEIEFKPWQCIAELVDNSVDGFLKMVREGTPIADPLVQIAFGRESVVVKDNGPGMSIDLLEMAVKAGWTSNDRFGNLGLYGVGFNIATARLGSLTQIWTTASGDKLWYGLEIDLKKMASGGTYTLQVKTRSKSNVDESGTEVEVSKIKPDWVNYLNNASWLRTNVTERLARIYGTMLREDQPQPIKFSLRVNDKRVPAWQHCVWAADWTVYRKGETLVRPIQEIDVQFGTKYVSRSSGELYESLEGVPDDDVMAVSERVYGWLGIQRYADEREFGIDILRNGRKIEIDCKDIFNWEEDDGTISSEYPIDDPRYRGRIVGEIHLDHGYVHYTKHRFEREHYSWKQLMQAVKHSEPLTRRAQRGFEGANQSPLGLLFRVFRRNSPSPGQKYWDILLIKDHDKAKRWAQEYRKGTPEYLNDERWREEINKADAANEPKPPQQTEPPTNEGETGSADVPDLDGEMKDGVGQENLETDIGLNTGGVGFDAAPGEIPQSEQAPTRTAIPQLKFHINGIGLSGKTYEVETFSIDGNTLLPTAPPWRSRVTERGIFEIEVNLEHPAFNTTSLQVSDAVLADLAHYITSEELASTGLSDGISYANILATLRNRYARSDSLDVNEMRSDIDKIRKQMAKALGANTTEEEQRQLLSYLPQTEISQIELARARSKGLPLVAVLEMRHFAFLLDKNPAWFFMAGCFNVVWTPPLLAQNIILLEEYQKQVTQDVWFLLVKLAEFSNPMSTAAETTRSSLALVRACINRMQDYLPE